VAVATVAPRTKNANPANPSAIWERERFTGSFTNPTPGLATFSAGLTDSVDLDESVGGVSTGSTVDPVEPNHEGTQRRKLSRLWPRRGMGRRPSAKKPTRVTTAMGPGGRWNRKIAKVPKSPIAIAATSQQNTMCASTRSNLARRRNLSSQPTVTRTARSKIQVSVPDPPGVSRERSVVLKRGVPMSDERSYIWIAPLS
jgi:hypothetical protein